MEATENIEERACFGFIQNDPSPISFKCKCVPVNIWDCMSEEKIPNVVHSILS